MFNSIKEYASSVGSSASETYTNYTSKDPTIILLIEITSNDQWTVSN
jgi:epsin